MRSMRVLMLAPEFLPIRGGVGNYIAEISKRLPTEVEMYIVTPRQKPCTGCYQLEDERQHDVFPDNVRLIHLGEAKDYFFHNFSFQVNCAVEVRRLVGDLGIDIVHSHSAMPDFFVSPKSVGIPFITTIHTTIEGHRNALRDSGVEFSELTQHERVALLFGPVLKRCEDMYYRKDRQYSTVSEWGKESILKEKNITPENIRVIRPGVDLSVFNHSMSRVPLQMIDDVDSPKVLYLSRMATRKGIFNLLKAIPKILDKLDVHFILAGSGRVPAELIPRENVTFLGQVPMSYPPILYAKSDVFVLPSLYENFPVCLLESMASGCAVVCSDVGGVREMVSHEKNGLIIRPNDVSSIEDGIIRVIEDTDLRTNMVRDAGKLVAQGFTWDATTSETLAQYESILERDTQDRE